MEEEPLDIREYLAVALRWWWLLLAAPLLTGGAALAINVSGLAEPLVSPPAQYEAVAVVLVEDEGNLAHYPGGNLAEYPDLVKSGPVLNGALKEIGGALNIADIGPLVSAERVPKTQFLRIAATAGDPDLAIRIAGSVAGSFVQYAEGISQSRLAAAREDLARTLAALEAPVSPEMADQIAAALTAAANKSSIIVPAELVGNGASAAGPGSVSSRAARDGLIAVALGVALAVVAIFLLEYVRNPIRSPAQLERRFGLAFLGSAPRWSGKGGPTPGLVITDGSSPAAAESIRQLATAIELGATTRGVKTVLISSADAGEGRSSLVANLGVALAAGWKNVVLVDADLRRPSLHRYFDVDNSVGLNSFLPNPGADSTGIIQGTAYERLRVVAGGPVTANPVEMLKSPQLESLLDHLVESADIVLVDSPPVLAAADAVVLAAHTDAIVLIADASSSKMETMKAILNSFQQAKSTILGFVWNRVPPHPFSFVSRFQGYHRGLPASPVNASSQGPGEVAASPGFSPDQVGGTTTLLKRVS